MPFLCPLAWDSAVKLTMVLFSLAGDCFCLTVRVGPRDLTGDAAAVRRPALLGSAAVGAPLCRAAPPFAGAPTGVCWVLTCLHPGRLLVSLLFLHFFFLINPPVYLKQASVACVCSHVASSLVFILGLILYLISDIFLGSRPYFSVFLSSVIF